jgi:chemotaxis signal transduction protein
MFRITSYKKLKRALKRNPLQYLNQTNATINRTRIQNFGLQQARIILFSIENQPNKFYCLIILKVSEVAPCRAITKYIPTG